VRGTHLVFIVNDQSTTAYLPVEARVTVFLQVNRDSKSGADAYLNVSTIDTDSMKH
jgi:hypothetical protein